jgi:hypothetical protein
MYGVRLAHPPILALKLRFPLKSLKRVAKL